MTTYATDAEAIAREANAAAARAIETMIKDGAPICMREGEATWRTYHAGFDLSAFSQRITDEVAAAILSYLASRREAQEPVAGELLPCPFCGGAAETDSQQAYRNISTGRTETAVAVYCTSCGAQHTICRGDVPGAELSDVTELWNKRAAPPSPVPAPAGEAERLRGALEAARRYVAYRAAHQAYGTRSEETRLVAQIDAALNGARHD